MKKLFLLAVASFALIACERNFDNNVTGDNRQNYEKSKKESDSINGAFNQQTNQSENFDTTDPKDIMVPPRH